MLHFSITFSYFGSPSDMDFLYKYILFSIFIVIFSYYSSIMIIIDITLLITVIIIIIVIIITVSNQDYFCKRL